MNCEIRRTRTTSRSKSRLYEPHTGTYYSGYSQNLFERQLTVAYIFARKAPENGATLIDRLSGKQYEVKNVIHLQNGGRISSYEIVLGHV